MPVHDAGLTFPRANVQFEQPEFGVTVEADDGTEHTAAIEPEERPLTVDQAGIHSQEGSGAFETPGPYTVTLEGYGPEGDDAKGRGKAQTKVVKPKGGSKPSANDGAETK